jgi:osmoprotectant transport system permease protein
MEFIGEVIGWLTDPASWQGRNAIGVRIWEQVYLSAASVGLALLIAIPVGLAIGHTNRAAGLVVSIANIGRAVPSLGWLGIFFPIVLLLRTGASGPWTALVALTLLAIPPIVTNTYVGIREVDDDLLEAARGLGMREREVLRRVEIPLALPVIMAGIRTSAVQVVATATLAAVVSGGTLGVIIIQGINGGARERLVGAALLVALLSILTEVTFSLLERATVSRGVHRPDIEDAMLEPTPPRRPGGEVAI